MNISQSLIKDVMWNAEVCPRFIHYRYILKEQSKPTDAMLKGLYFEWHLLGNVRSGIEPKFDRLTGGGKSKVEVEMEAAVARAKHILIRMGIKVQGAQCQEYIEVYGMDGHIDLISNDFQKPGGLAIYDVKWTDTKIDDRWNMGWADAENKPEVRLQAIHYTKLYYEKYGVYLPFYYLVFGKSGWVRVIRIQVTSDAVSQHMFTMQLTADKLTEMGSSGWAAKPEFNKCNDCPFNSICDSKAMVPRVEVIVF